MLCLYNALCTKFWNNQENKVKNPNFNSESINSHRVWHNQNKLTSQKYWNIFVDWFVVWKQNSPKLSFIRGTRILSKTSKHSSSQHTDATQKGLSPLPLLNESDFSLIISSKRLPQGPSAVHWQPRDGFFGTWFLIKAHLFSLDNRAS